MTTRQAGAAADRGLGLSSAGLPGENEGIWTAICVLLGPSRQPAFGLGHWFDSLLFQGQAIIWSLESGGEALTRFEPRQRRQELLTVRTRIDFHNLRTLRRCTVPPERTPYALFLPRTLCLRGPGEKLAHPGSDGPRV